MGQFLDKTGLGTLWTKIKDTFALKAHGHTGMATISTLSSGNKDTIPLMDHSAGLSSSGKKIVDSITGSSNVPTDAAVKNYADTTFATKTQLASLSGDNIPKSSTDTEVSINQAITELASSKLSKTEAESTYATKTELSNAVTSAMHYKGTVASSSALPTTDNVVGDVWNVTDTGANYAWNGTTWDELSGVTDLSAYLTKTEAGNTYAVKTDLDAYLTKTSASSTYVPKTSSGTEAQANITNENGEVFITSAENGISVVPEGVGLFSATQDGMNLLSVNDTGAFMNDNQLLDSSMALTTAEIEAVCV